MTDTNKKRETGIDEGRIARLDPYLGQSLKKIVPNAYVVLIFVGVSVSHDIFTIRS